MPTPVLSTRRATVAVVAILAALTTVTLPEPPAGATGSSGPGTIQISAEELLHHGLRVNDRRMSVYAAAPEKVRSGSGFVVGGDVTLTGNRRRPATVRLLQLSGSRWVVKQVRRTTRQGHYRFSVPGFSAAQVVTLRVRASTGRQNRDSSTVRVQVVTAAASPPTAGLSGLGDPADYTRISGAGWRWNPCQVITWRYNGGRGYPQAQAHVQEALRRISLHTGLKFQYAGTTTHVPFTGRAFPSNADIVVAWAGPLQSRYLEGGVVGVAAPSGVSTGNGAGEFLSGAVLLDSSAAYQLAPGFATQGRATWGQVMTHELLHVMGLNHAKGAVQLMAPYITPQNHLFGAGDLAGMKAIGATNGCVADSQR